MNSKNNNDLLMATVGCSFSPFGISAQECLYLSLSILATLVLSVRVSQLYVSTVLFYKLYDFLWKWAYWMTTLHYLIALQYGISVIGWKILKNKHGGYYIGLLGHYIKNHV